MCRKTTLSIQNVLGVVVSGGQLSRRSNRTIESGRVGVLRLGGEYKLVCTEPVPADEYLFQLEGHITSRPSRYSVQVGLAAHVDLPVQHLHEEALDLFYWRFMNHSCEPNTMVCGRRVLTLKPIARWEEITFHYNTTEYDMAEPFDCHCGSQRCEGRIEGFRYLAPREQEYLRPWLAAHLRRVLEERTARVGAPDREGVMTR